MQKLSSRLNPVVFIGSIVYLIALTQARTSSTPSANPYQVEGSPCGFTKHLPISYRYEKLSPFENELKENFSRISGEWKRSFTNQMFQGVVPSKYNGEIPKENEMEEYLDLLHGFTVNIPSTWNVKVLNNSIVISDLNASKYIAIRTSRHGGNIKNVLESLMLEKKSILNPNSNFLYKNLKGGMIVIGENLGYPFMLNPMMTVNFGLFGVSPPNDYKEITFILPAKSMAIVSSLFFPSNTEKREIDEMMDIMKSFKFIPRERMISWSEQVIRDLETGAEAGKVHIPSGFEYKGYIIKQGTKRVPTLFIRKGHLVLRRDNVDIQSSALQTGFGGNSTSIITINGQSFQQTSPISLQSKNDLAEVVLDIWKNETGMSWELEEAQETEKSDWENIMEQQSQQMLAQTLMAYRRFGRSEYIKLKIVAANGNLKRIGWVQGFIVWSQVSDMVASGQDMQVSISIHTLQVSKERELEDMGILRGINSSIYLDPKSTLSAFERFTQENRELNQMVMEHLREEREYNSQMSKAWSNALSNQTYVKDPSSGEIMRVHKNSWETGEFWKDPVWGEVIGGVEKGSEMEELLREKGWIQLEQSLEGFQDKE